MGIPNQMMSKAQVQDSKGPLEWEDPVRTKRLGVLGEAPRLGKNQNGRIQYLTLKLHIYIHRISYNH